MGICDLVGNKVIIFTCERTDTVRADFVCSKGLGEQACCVSVLSPGDETPVPGLSRLGPVGCAAPSPGRLLLCRVPTLSEALCSRLAVLVQCTRPCLEPTRILASALLLKNIN